MERQSNHGPGALSGYRVLDLCAAPGVLCTKILADLGADVIKVEPPAGNATRYRGPFYQEQADPEKSLFFWYFHTNKRSITLDLETLTGQALLHRLLATTDALVETFPPGYLDGLGLSFRHLRALYPRLVMTSITGFGSTGPYSQYKAPDIVGLAMGGLAYLCGEPHGPPAPPGGLQGYHLAALNGAVGTLIALWHREATGQGQHVHVSMQAAVANTLETTHQMYDFNREIRTRCGHRREGGACILPCQDGYVALVLAGQLGWRRLIAWLSAEGAVGALADERLVDDVYRFEHDAEVYAALQAFFATKTKQQAYTEAQHYRVPLAPVQTARDLVESPQLQARQFFVDVEHPDLGMTLRYPGAPYALSTTPWQLRRRPPRLGEHNAEIIASLPPLPFPPSPLAGEGETEPWQPVQPALQGIRVLDFSWFGAVPIGTKILADHGAEVIRVESMARPDLLRLIGSSHFRDYTPDLNGSGFFNDFNSSKYGITLNLNHPEGVAIAKRLVTLSDVVIDNFTRRAMRKWGLYYDDLVQIKPDIIVVSAAQQGHTGPHADYLGFGYNLQALAGINHLTGSPDGYPLGTSVNYPDFVLPMFVASVIMSALLYRRRTGTGQHIDLSQYQAMASTLGPMLMDYMINGRIAARTGGRSATAAPHGVYRCQGDDRWCVIAVCTEDEWVALCRVMGHPAWTKEARFHTMARRLQHVEALDALLHAWTMQHTPEYIMHLLQSAGVAAGVVQNAADLLEHDPQLRHHGHYHLLQHPVTGPTLYMGSPFLLSATPAALRPAPCLGQHNAYVYGELLGMNAADMARYTAEGIFY
jgi:crotonobetainyl-CoA:carnitine CoA-transferase CaiB-like acyl-CoA transferase